MAAAEVRRDEFLAQRSPRRGTANPERMAMPVWEWLVRTRLSAYEANQQFDGPDVHEAGPGWSFDRFGCSRTELPDGRIVRIAGEHEDGYDPDFYIYSDVVVCHPDGRVEIFGYPEDAFPPTDFHSATLDEGRQCIWIVGNLGYPEQRRPDETPVYRLDLNSFAIAPVATTGDLPGWLHRHGAELADDGRRLVVSRGITVDEDDDLFDSIDDWSLDLETLAWTRLTAREFQQWSIERVDGDDLMLDTMQHAAFELRYPEAANDRAELPELDELGIELDPVKALAAEGRQIDDSFDQQFDQLFCPPMPSTEVPALGSDPASNTDMVEADENDADDHFRINYADNTSSDQRRWRIGDALVRYAQEHDAILIKIEGELPPEQVTAICDDCAAKLARLQGSPCEALLVYQLGEDDD